MKKFIAFIVAAALTVSMLSIFAVQGADAGLTVEPNADGSFKVTVTAETQDDDWVGIYKEGEQYGSGEGTSTSLIWYYIDENTKTINWPADKDKADQGTNHYPAYIENGIDSAGNRPDDLNDDLTLKPGKYYAIILGTDYSDMASGAVSDWYADRGYSKFEFEIKAAGTGSDTDEGNSGNTGDSGNEGDTPNTDTGDVMYFAVIAAAAMLLATTVIKKRVIG